MSPSDPSATLEAIKERAKSAAAMEVGLLSAFSGVSVGGVIAASAVDVSRLVAALEAVLELHQPEMFDGRDADGQEFSSRECVTCDNGGLRDNWPCGTVLAITRALKGDTDA